jgi:hypothetical protein
MASIVAALVRVMTSQPRFFFHALTLEEVRSVFLALSLAIVPTGALAVWFQRDGAAAASWLRGGAIALPLVALYRFVPTWWRRRRRAAAWRQDMVGLVAVVTGANGDLGVHTTTELVRRGATVVMACRDVKRGEAARDAVMQQCAGEGCVGSAQVCGGCVWISRHDAALSSTPLLPLPLLPPLPPVFHHRCHRRRRRRCRRRRHHHHHHHHPTTTTTTTAVAAVAYTIEGRHVV